MAYIFISYYYPLSQKLESILGCISAVIISCVCLHSKSRVGNLQDYTGWAKKLYTAFFAITLPTLNHFS